MHTVVADNAFGTGRRLSKLGMQQSGKKSSDQASQLSRSSHEIYLDSMNKSHLPVKGKKGRPSKKSHQNRPSTSRVGATPGAELRANLIQDMSSGMEVSAEADEFARRKVEKKNKKFAKTRGKRATRMRLASENEEYHDDVSTVFRHKLSHFGNVNIILMNIFSGIRPLHH